MKKNKILLFWITGLLFLMGCKIDKMPTKWRGENNNGIYNEVGLLKEWPTTGPEIIWHFDGLGEGHSSPVFANGLIYLSTGIDSLGYIIVLTPEGKQEWKTSYGKEYYKSYPGSRSSPVVFGELLYIYSGHGVLTCMGAIDGIIKWQKDGFTDFDGQNTVWGVSETVAVNGDIVYFTPGGKKNNVVALNRFNGDLIWSSEGMGEISAYCSPLLVDLPARKLLVTMTAEQIIGIDAAAGNLLWSYPHTNKYWVHANTPVFYKGDLFCFSGYGQGGVKLNLSDDGGSVEKAWFNENLDNQKGGMVAVDGYLYGSGDKRREWRCIDWETGEEKYASEDLGKGVVIYADGMLYCYSDRGELALVEATPEAFKLVSKTKVELGTGQHWAHPVMYNGKLYVRHGNVLMAYKIK